MRRLKFVGLALAATALVALAAWVLVPGEVWATTGRIILWITLIEFAVLPAAVLDWREAERRYESRSHAWAGAHASMWRRLFARAGWAWEVATVAAKQAQKPASGPTPATPVVNRGRVIEHVPAQHAASTDLVRAA